jgi:tripartite ATP-independent transporter DctM subunit
MIICILIFAVMTAMILLGIPLSVSMLICSLVGLTLVSGFDLAINQFTGALFTLSHSYTFAVIPLFMVVGTLASVSGMAEGTFTAAKKWTSRTRGGLLYAVILANMVFGACSGMSVAGNIVFTKIAMPELRKSNYDETLSIGTITCAGSLSVLIPPSIPIIMFCLLTNVSIGQALVGGISTGIIFAILMMLMVFVISKIKPGLIPPAIRERVPLKEKLLSLRLLIPILFLFIMIVGGSFLGWFPATAAGAVGVVVILGYCFLRRVPAKKIFSGVMDGVSSFAVVYLIIVAGQLFSRFITVTGLTQAISDGIASLDMAPYGVFCIVFLFYLLCGCFMDCLSIIVITVPVIFPILSGLGFNDIVLVIVLVFAMEIAALTPPVGIGVFYVANAAKMPVSQVFRSVVPFFIFDIALVLLIAAIPEVVTWLPSLLGY